MQFFFFISFFIGFNSFACQKEVSTAADGAPFQETRLVSLEEEPYLAHHVVKGKIFLPGAYLIEWALNVAARMTSGSEVEIKNVRIVRPVILEKGSPQPLTLTIDGNGLTIKNRDHACMKAKMGEQAIAPFVRSQPDVAPDIDGLYNFLSAQGLDYGPSFRTLSLVDVDSRTATGALSLHRAVKANASLIHPTILDGAFHALASLN